MLKHKPLYPLHQVIQFIKRNRLFISAPYCHITSLPGFILEEGWGCRWQHYLSRTISSHFRPMSGEKRSYNGPGPLRHYVVRGCDPDINPLPRIGQASETQRERDGAGRTPPGNVYLLSSRQRNWSGKDVYLHFDVVIVVVVLQLCLAYFNKASFSLCLGKPGISLQLVP